MPNKDRNLKNKTNSEYYHRNKERILEKLKDKFPTYYSENKETLLENTKRFRERHPARTMFQHCKSRSKRSGIEFSIDVEDIVIPTHCPYLGVELTWIVGNGVEWFNPSIDRIDPTKGYIKGNIEIISRKANTMKNNASQEELITFAKSILNKHESKIIEYIK